MHIAPEAVRTSQRRDDGKERTVTTHDFMIIFQRRRYISLVSDEAAVAVGVIGLVVLWVEG
jgi:hypothetical protein